jgi:hypothetical protein
MPVFLRRLEIRLLKYMHFSKPERCMEGFDHMPEKDSSRLTLRISSLAQRRENETKIRQYYDALYRAWGAALVAR